MNRPFQSFFRWECARLGSAVAQLAALDRRKAAGERARKHRGGEPERQLGGGTAGLVEIGLCLVENVGDSLVGIGLGETSARGHELSRVALPVPRPTSPTFGGDGLNELYVTTASVGLGQKEIERSVEAGDLFRIVTPTAGMPEHAFAAA